MGGLAWQWFVSTPLARSNRQDTGLQSFLFCSEKFGNDLVETVNKAILEFGRYNYQELFTIYLRDRLKQKDKLYDYLKTMVGMLVQEINNGRLETQIESYLLSQGFKYSENFESHVQSEQISALQFLTEWWIHKEDVIDIYPQFSEAVVSLLKINARAKRRTVREAAISQLFLLLDFFTFKKSSFAPLLFKTLTFILVDAYNEDSTRCFIQHNFIHFIRTTPTIPVGIIIEPLVKQIAGAPILRLDLHDFSFFETLAHHPKLSAKSAISLLDVLARLHLTHDFYAHLLVPSFLDLCQRFLENCTQFLVQFSRISLDKLVQLEKATSKKMIKSASTPALKRNASRLQRDTSIVKAQIIEILLAIIELRSEPVNSILKDLLLETNYNFHKKIGRDHSGILFLLQSWGEVSQMLVMFQADYEQRKREEQLHTLVPIDLSGDVSRRNFSPGPIMPYSLSTLNEKPKTSSIAFKAKQRIREIKKKRDEEAQKLIEAEHAKEELLLRQKQAVKSQFEKRKIQHGVSSLNQKDQELTLLFREGVAHRLVSREKKGTNSEVNLLDLNEEQTSEKEAINLLLHKYRKLFRYIFTKYANSQYSSKRAESFDQIQGKRKTINNAEIMKMLKDHDLLHSFINKDETILIIRRINLEAKRADLASLPYESFAQFILQLAVFCYSRPPLDLSGGSPLGQIQALLTHLQKVAQAKHFSTFLYDDPEASALGDQEVLRELNLKLKKNPNYTLPEGYKKVEEKQIIFDFKIPPLLQLSESKAVALEVLDNMISAKMGFHFLEPVARTVKKISVKPVIRRTKARSAQYLSPLNKQPREDLSEGRISRKSKERLLARKEIPPKLGIQLRLEVASVPIRDREHVQETAEVLEEILQASQKGLRSLPPRRKYAGKVDNRVKEEHRKSQERERAAMKLRDAKLAKRQAEIKKQLEEMKKKKQEEEKKKEENEEKEEKKRKAKKHAQEAKWKKIMDERLAKAKQDRRKAQEEKEAKEEEEAKKQAELSKQMKARHQRFLSQQRKKLNDQNKRVASERAKERKKKEWEESREKARAKLARKYFEEKVKVFQDKRSQKLKKIKEDYNNFYEDEKVQSVVQRYQGFLRVLFYEYAKLSIELNKDITKQMETVNLKKLLQFAYDFNITPTLCLADEYIHIYNHILKEDHTLSLNLDFNKFKDFLVRVAIIGRKVLQGRNEKVMKISKSSDLHPMKKRKAPREQEFWEPDLDTTGLSQKVVQSLFLYLGLDDKQDEVVLKRRLKALRNKLAQHPPGPIKLRKNLQKLARVPLTRKELREKQKKEKQFASMTQLEGSLEKTQETEPQID